MSTINSILLLTSLMLSACGEARPQPDVEARKPPNCTVRGWNGRVCHECVWSIEAGKKFADELAIHPLACKNMAAGRLAIYTHGWFYASGLNTGSIGQCANFAPSVSLSVNGYGIPLPFAPLSQGQLVAFADFSRLSGPIVEDGADVRIAASDQSKGNCQTCPSGSPGSCNFNGPVSALVSDSKGDPKASLILLLRAE